MPPLVPLEDAWKRSSGSDVSEDAVASCLLPSSLLLLTVDVVATFRLDCGP